MNEPTKLVFACSIDAIGERPVASVEVEGRAIALIRDGESFHALSGRCPHAGGNLGRGWLEDGEVVCPLHRWRFRLIDGKCTTVRGEWARVYRCEQRDGVVWLDLSD